MLAQTSFRTSLRFLVVCGLCVLVSGCAAKLPDSEQLLEVGQPGPIAVKADQTIRFGERITGLILDIDDKGNFLGEPVADLDVAMGGRRGLLDMFIHENRTFASWVSSDDRLTVGEINPGTAPRIIWTGPTAAPDHIGGALTMSRMDRLTMAIGDMQRPTDTPDPDSVEGTVISLDPEGSPDQRPNVLSRGWSNPGGIAYDGNNNLWIAEGASPARITRTGPDGAVGTPTELGENAGPSDLQLFGQSELLVCERNTRLMQRYLINDGVEALPGRKVATDCGGSVAEMANGRIVYGADTSLRITAE